MLWETARWELESTPSEVVATGTDGVRLCTSDSRALELAPICAWNEAKMFGRDSPNALEKAWAKTPLSTDRWDVDAEVSGAVEEFPTAVHEFTGTVDGTIGESTVEDIVAKLLLVDRTMTSRFFNFSWPENAANTDAYYARSTAKTQRNSWNKIYRYIIDNSFVYTN